MPGFGLQGPWRDYVGWALNIEQTSGMSAVTGYPDGPPCNPQGPADPIVGVHAGVALLAALEHRSRTGEGQLIEIAQIEVAACVTAEPVIEYSMNGVVRRGRATGGAATCRASTRRATTACGWRCRCPTSGDSTTTCSTRWSARGPARGRPRQIVETLRAQGIPAEQVITGERMYDGDLIGAQLDARGILRGVRASGHRGAPLSRLAVSDHPRTGPPSSRRPADAGSAQRRNPGRPGPVGG